LGLEHKSFGILAFWHSGEAIPSGQAFEQFAGIFPGSSTTGAYLRVLPGRVDLDSGSDGCGTTEYRKTQHLHLLIFFDWADRQRSKRFGDGMHFDPRMLRGLSEASESHFSVGQTSALAAVENGVLAFWHFDK
jgi:hypothetical protein